MEDESIRPMRMEDLKAVLAIERVSFSTPWSIQSFTAELRENEYAHYFCLVVEEQVIGYMGLWYILEEGHITNIAISPEYRGKGFGEFLIRSVMQNMRSTGMERMTLEVRVSNFTAQKLYERLGFVTAGVRKRYYADNREDALIMWAEFEKKTKSGSEL